MQLALLNLPWWGYVLVTLALTHVTIAAVTIFLHRHQAHRAISLHPIVSHFFRFWLWLTTGMVTKEWVAIHRKHHAKCETPEDPHSPQIFGINQVLFTGSELYRAEARNRDTIARYGNGTPDDWLERHVYGKYTAVGVGALLVIEVALFGAIGLTVWAVQMLWIPIFAAGVVNGIGHYWGYRNFVTRDASRNIVPWGILIGGEELHNNHHAYSSSARLSNRWWEFDVGWMYIRLLQILRLATVHRVEPTLRINLGKTRCDIETVQAVITHRFDVLAKFARAMQRTAIKEIRDLQARAVPGLQDGKAIAAIKHWLRREDGDLPQPEREALEQALHSSIGLRTIYAMRQELVSLWSRTTTSQEQLAKQLEYWCQCAEATGIGALQEFSRKLRCYN
jgi:stearoyl-CoA desaturase (delta-9 desaturase)